MAEIPTLYVCHGDEGGPRIHPCRRVQEALHAAGIEYEKVIAAHGSPLPFLRKGSREGLREATGQTKLPALKLSDGTVIAPSRAILAWITQQGAAQPGAGRPENAQPTGAQPGAAQQGMKQPEAAQSETARSWAQHDGG